MGYAGLHTVFNQRTRRNRKRMSYRSPELLAWEKKLNELFNRVDTVLEERHGQRFPRRANRPPHGSPAAPAYDGLFNIGASYTRGIGSQQGPGYILELRIATTRFVPSDVFRALEDEAAELVQNELPTVFPGRALQITRDGTPYKIYGDLSLSSRKPKDRSSKA